MTATLALTGLDVLFILLIGISILSTLMITAYIIIGRMMNGIDLTLTEEEGDEIIQIFKNGLRNSQWD